MDSCAQFERIADVCAHALADEQPVISCDCKKEGLIGSYKTAGRELAPTGKPILVNTHHFIGQKLCKMIPLWIHDVGRNEGRVSVGISTEIACSIRVTHLPPGTSRWNKIEIICSAIARLIGPPNL